MKFIEAYEIDGKYPDHYVGIELEKSKDEVSILAVDMKNIDDIGIFDLTPSEYRIKPVDKEKVHHYFTLAMKKQMMRVTDAEIDLMKARRNLKFCENKLKQLFKGPVQIDVEQV